MLIVHHLGISQSERIVWLCEELGLEYKLVKHTRDPLMSPESLKSVPGNATGKSPFLEDPDAGITLSESGAICDYIVAKYGGDAKLTLGPDDNVKDYINYLYWFHFANGTLQAAMVGGQFIDAVQLPADNMIKQFIDGRVANAIQVVDERLKDNEWLAGERFTIADIMTVYSLTTQRYWGQQISLAPYKNVLRYLRDVAARPAYQRAMEKGDPDMKIMNGPDPPEVSMIAAGGTKSDHWKKK